MILGIGVDLLNVSRLKHLIKNEHLLYKFSKRILCKTELNNYQLLLKNEGIPINENIWDFTLNNNKKKTKIISNEAFIKAVEDLDHNSILLKFLATRWSLKEAIYKAAFPSYRLTWKEVEVVNYNAKPCIKFLALENTEESRWVALNRLKVHSSVSNEGEFTTAFVILEY